MKKKLFVILILGAVAVFVSCNLFGGGKEDYYPTTVGSKWDYSGYVLRSTATDATPDTIEKINVTVRATKKDKLNTGEDVTEMVSTMDVHIYYPMDTTYTGVDTSYIRETENAVLEYGSKSEIEPDTILALPLTKDKTWSNDSYKVIDQENVTVPAGTYKKAWKIEHTTTEGGETYKEYYWFANNIGLAKVFWQQSYGTDLITFTIELVSASIK